VPVTDQLVEGANLLLVGMGIVLFFLLVLVFATLAMSRLAMALDKGPGNAEDAAPEQQAIAQGEEVSEEIVGVIAGAVARYRADRR